MGLRVSPRVDLREVSRLDPHSFPFQQPEHARLARFRPLVLAVRAVQAIVGLVRGRFLVCGDVALVIAQDDLVVAVADQVVGHDRNLAAAAGSIDDVRRDGVAAGVAAEALHDLEALAYRGPEMAGALDQVALV